jgi:predicted O-methyltransferase YrrM
MINTFDILNFYLSQNDKNSLNCEDSQISINQYISSILDFIIHVFKPKIIIELGTLYGKSAISMAQSNPDAQIHTIENNEKHYNIAKKNILNHNLSNRITLHLGDCMEILATDKIQNLSPDMIFIDANKARYLDYLSWAKEFLNKNGIIVADNIFVHKVIEKYKNPNNNIHKNMEIFLERVQNKDLFNTLIIPYERDGISISIKK